MTVVEATSRRQWVYPSRHKRPPTQIVIFLVNILRYQKYPVLRIRVDEGGELARSTSFLKTLVDVLHVVIETTGGYNSENNGKVEAAHRPAKRGVRMMLMTAGLSDRFWCFALQYQTFIKNNSIHSQTKQVPEHHFNSRSSLYPLSNIPIFGARARIVRKTKELQALEPRTGGDPRLISNFVPDADLPRQPLSHDGIFVGFANHPRVMLVWEPKKHRISRVAHGIVDEFAGNLKDDKLSPAEFLLRNHPFALDSSNEAFNEKVSELVTESQLTFIRNPFDSSKCFTINVTLPPSSFVDLGLIFEDDDIHGLPILVDIKPDSPLLPFIKISYIKRKHHIVSIGKMEPITSFDAVDYLTQHQKRRRTSSVAITLCPVNSKALVSEYETFRGYHDSMTHQVRHLVQATTKPPCPKTFWDCIDTPHKKDWIEACYKQYDKNMRVGMYSKPIPP